MNNQIEREAAKKMKLEDVKNDPTAVAAYEKIFGEFYPEGELPPLEDTTFPRAYLAGFTAARKPDWVEIRTVDDLPKEDGFYDFTHLIGEAKFIVRIFMDKDFRATIAAQSEQDGSKYIAWIPTLDPYHPAHSEGEKV